MLTVKTVYDCIAARAPFETQLDFDNAGLLTGSMNQEVTGILAALDCTEAVVAEAERLHANLIFTHHPLMFASRKRITEDEPEGRLLCRLIRGRMALLSAHTNLDQAAGGINDVLAAACGLGQTVGSMFLRVGNLAAPMTGEALSQELSGRLHTVIRMMGDGSQIIHRLGVSSGAGSDSWEEARALGADAFLSGEVKHHHALACASCGMLALEAGHFATEAPGIFAAADALQNDLNALQYKVRVYKSLVPGYGR